MCESRKYATTPPIIALLAALKGSCAHSCECGRSVSEIRYIIDQLPYQIAITHVVAHIEEHKLRLAMSADRFTRQSAVGTVKSWKGRASRRSAETRSKSGRRRR